MPRTISLRFSMSLHIGTRLGSNEITALLGKGGMGEVYRARDTKLQRDIAIKLLPDAFATDPERTARFEREAKLLAALNHPNIASIYGFESGALVMELVEGETLADRLKRGPVQIEDSLEICKQVTEALEAAHQKGILHRDLKPSNIQITPEGRVKVLDFGLAKMMERPHDSDSATASAGVDAFSDSPTLISAANTGRAVIIGTVAYMSPEQLFGRAFDQRTDMWAFGCVLFETLTRERAFKGDDVAETVAAIVKGQPDWNLLPAETPATIRSLLRQCLRKQPQRRLHDARAARIALEDAIAEPAPVPVPGGVPTTARRPWKRVLPFLAASIVVGAIGAWILKPSPPVDRIVTKLLLDVQPAERFAGSVTSPRPSRTAIALSPDGRTIVFSGVRGTVTQLFKRRLDEVEATAMAGTEGAVGPFFSPDGHWIGFWANNKLKKAPAGGGPPVVICDVPAYLGFGLYGVDWGSDDTIVFSADSEG